MPQHMPEEGAAWEQLAKNKPDFGNQAFYSRTPLDEPTCSVDLGLSLLCAQEPLLHSLKSSSKSAVKYAQPPQMSKEQNLALEDPLPRGCGHFAWGPFLLEQEVGWW